MSSLSSTEYGACRRVFVTNPETGPAQEHLRCRAYDEQVNKTVDYFQPMQPVVTVHSRKTSKRLRICSIYALIMKISGFVERGRGTTERYRTPSIKKSGVKIPIFWTLLAGRQNFRPPFTSSTPLLQWQSTPVITFFAVQRLQEVFHSLCFRDSMDTTTVFM